MHLQFTSALLQDRLQCEYLSICSKLYPNADVDCLVLQVAFYDTEATTGVLLQGLNEDTNGVQNATGEKVCLVWHCTFVAGAQPAHASEQLAAWVHRLNMSNSCHRSANSYITCPHSLVALQ